MSEVEVLKSDVAEIKADVKDISSQIADLRVLVAGGYVTKREFEEYRKTESNNRYKLASAMIAISGVVAGIVTEIFK